MSKYEESYVELDPSLACVEWKDECEPIEIYIEGEIDQENTSDFETNFRNALRSKQTVIPIIINSEGGCVYNATKIVDLLASCDKEIVTICRGAAFSAAALIFSCGDRRYVTPHSSLMLHSVSSLTEGGTVAELRCDVAEADRLNSSLCEIFDKNCGKRKGYFEKLLKNNIDVYMPPSIAIKHNLATEIADVRLTTRVDVVTELEVLKPIKRVRE